MKKTHLTIAILLCLSLPAFSQFTKGKIMAGGTVSASANTYKNSGSPNSTSSSVNFNPQVGYFFANNFAAGAGLDFSATKSKFSGNTTATSNVVSFAPFARYYVDKFYGQASLQFGSNKFKSDGISGVDRSDNSTGWSLAAGYAYLLNEHVAIEPQVGYKATYFKSDRNYGYLFLNIGLQVYIGR